MSGTKPFYQDTEIEIFVLPGGRMPERKSEGAIGYDVYARAIVSETEQSPLDDS